MFIVEYIKNPKSVGAFAPSSKKLAKKMIAPIEFKDCKCIVEYGPGTGIFTDEIILRKKEETIFIIIEQNLEFYDRLYKKYKNKQSVHVINGNAADVKKYLNIYGQNKADYVISGLPFTSLPKDISKKIFMETKDIIKESGKFITFQYTLIKKKLFLQWFGVENISYETWNFPPAFVLEMKNR